MSPRLRKQAVVVMRSEVAVSERRACGLMELYRGTYRYRSRRPEDGRLRALEEENRQLKHIVAEQAVDIRARKAVVAKKW